MGSALCFILLSPLNQCLTKHEEEKGHWFHLPVPWSRQGAIIRWRGGVDLLWLFFNFLHRKHGHEARPDREKSSQWCFPAAKSYISLQFVTDGFTFVQWNCLVSFMHTNPNDRSQIQGCFRKLSQLHRVCTQKFLHLNHPVRHITFTWSHTVSFIRQIYSS